MGKKQTGFLLCSPAKLHKLINLVLVILMPFCERLTSPRPLSGACGLPQDGHTFNVFARMVFQTAHKHS